MKKILATLLLGLALTVAALAAAAETSGSPVTLTATDGGASVRLDLPADTVQGVKALRLRFAVESADPVEADFAFDSALPGSVQQYRYDAATGTMTVYVAGGRELFPRARLRWAASRWMFRRAAPPRCTWWRIPWNWSTALSAAPRPPQWDRCRWKCRRRRKLRPPPRRLTRSPPRRRQKSPPSKTRRGSRVATPRAPTLR